MDGAGDLRAYMISHLDEAIDKDWITVYYQPVVRTVTGKLCGMEALARWVDPQLGLVAPPALVESLEDARLIHKLDACMVRKVCRRLHDDIDAGRPIVPVSFNLSRLDFELCDIQDIIEEAARGHQVPHSLLNIEITESVFGADPRRMTEVINGFHQAGYQVWMDDFGSAYSSLNMLKDFEFDELKIDMAFLSRFGERSRAIIASVVDMAKRLGIETLAEGVETHEHAEFLRHIGCEKQQGFYYGRPEPYSLERIERFEWELGIEQSNERGYYRTIGSVNTLSLSERDFMPENTTKDYVTSMPLAFVEYDGEFFSVLDCNDPFEEALENLGLPDVETVEELMNDTTRSPARSSRRLAEVIEEQEFAHQDFPLRNGRTCVMRARHVATSGSRTTMLVTIDSAARMLEKERHSQMERSFSALHAIYEHIDIMHLDEDYAEPVYSQAVYKNVYDLPALPDAIAQFAANEVYPDDQERYLAFMDVDTMAGRIEETGQGFVADFFRTRDRGGDFAWKIVLLVRVAESEGRDVMICIRDTNSANDELFQAAFDPAGSATMPSGDASETAMDDRALWRTIVNNRKFGIFWKDADRRFIGCNRMFLDYFGLDSVGDIRGKTDEDMGWHIDPVPFRQEELRVLGEGAVIESEIGQCVVGGRIRDIVTSKQPVYRNGRITGLLGFFVDAADMRSSDSFIESSPFIDPVTGTLNQSGFNDALERYAESYQKTGANFALMMVEIDNYRHINEKYGYDFSDKVIGAIADVMRNAAGSACAVGHIRANRFAVLKQQASISEAEALCADSVLALASITEVEGTPTTVFAHAASARFSEADDVEDLKRIVKARLRNADLSMRTAL